MADTKEPEIAANARKYWSAEGYTPGVQAHLIDTLGGYDFVTKKKVLQDNACKLYNLTL